MPLKCDQIVGKEKWKVLTDSIRVKLQSWTIASFTVIQLCDCYIGRRIQSNVQLTLTAYKTGNRTSQTTGWLRHGLDNLG